MTEHLEIAFASKEAMSVRQFAVQEGLSQFFEVDVVALCANDEVDLEAIVGKAASFRIDGGPLGTALERNWAGVCRNIEQLQPEKTGLSTYHVVIVPELWLLTQRRGTRIFQHLTLPDIVAKVLDEWKIKPVTRYAQQYKKREYVVQYGETDFAFVSRLLEQAGITFSFKFEKGKVDLVLDDHPQDAETRPGPAIPWADNPSQGKHEYVTQVTVFHQVRPGKVTLRDHDFRRKPDYKLFGAAEAKGLETFYEQYHHDPGGFLEETGKGPVLPFADDRGVARYDDAAGKAAAERALLSVRRPKQVVGFATNCVDLTAGLAFTIDRHPRGELAQKLLVTEFSLGGTNDGEWHFAGAAVFAKGRYVPDLATPKPRIFGVQSAMVVGPKGEEIHTDEFGRVRVQFHWDRDGQYDDKSSCWMRVSQSWAGAGYGNVMLPRVGQEVLVGFFEGDPDQPVVVGRVYNATSKVPYKLPDHQTRSTWKSHSTPTAEGFNEIMLEDKKSEELLYVQAQRDLQKLVKQVEIERTKEKRRTIVGHDRSEVVSKVDSTMVGKRHIIEMIKPPSADDLKILAQGAPSVSPLPTRVEMTDGRVIFTTGKASVVFDKTDIYLEAQGNISVKAKGGSLILEGTTVYINSKSPGTAPKPGTVGDPIPKGAELDGITLKVAALKAAARDATPFCEPCAKGGI